MGSEPKSFQTGWKVISFPLISTYNLRIARCFMRDLDYLRLLSKSFPDIKSAGTEIINLSAICELPKGTEFFLSDVHGEYESFSYLMRSCSGVIMTKMKKALGNSLSAEEYEELSKITYYPEEVIPMMFRYQKPSIEWQKKTIENLILVARFVSSKYTRSKVRKRMPKAYGYTMDELINTNSDDLNTQNYHEAVVNNIIEIGFADKYIIELAKLIQTLCIDHLHIVGDIFDRGPRADKIMDELMMFPEIDIQWGNHDATWIGAANGNMACIANVLHIATLYNSFDVLESGYGINLRPLSMYAEELYKDDPCLRFRPHLLDANVSDSVSPDLASKMCKVITIIMFKLEGQLIKRHPEYHLGTRLLLDGLDIENKTFTIQGKTFPLEDSNLPTFVKDDIRALNDEELSLMKTLQYSFTHSERLQRHIRFLLKKGSMYTVYNGNLLYHACIPMNADGTFMEVETPDGTFSGKEYLDYCERRIRHACMLPMDDPKKEYETDFLWYMWCGPKSPLFGKDQITTYERTFSDDTSLYHEDYNPYYELAKRKDVVEMILEEFDADKEHGHIINGHVPVLVNKGESPIKAEGRLFKIDGGLAKSFHSKTGIAGYTLISNSHHIALVQHKNFVKGADNLSKVKIVKKFDKRILVKDTDKGKMLSRQIADLKELIEAYRQGRIPEAK